jgi:hypothetical protein
MAQTVTDSEREGTSQPTENETDTQTDSEGETQTDNDEQTQTDSNSETQTDNEDSTPTATGQPVYDIGQTFTVGSGDKTVEYVVNSVDAYSSIGSGAVSEDASGVFVVVVLEMTNQSEETIDVSSNHLKLIDDQDREFDADAGASVYVESDDRINAEGFAFEQLNPGLSTSGAVIYDVSPGTTYELMVEPVGIFSSANSKRVDLGEITAP